MNMYHIVFASFLVITASTYAAEYFMPNQAILITNKGAECYFNNALQGAFSSHHLTIFTQTTPYKKGSIGESYRRTLEMYIKTANSASQKPAYINPPQELTNRLFEAYPKLRPSPSFGTGFQGNPTAPLEAIIRHSMIESTPLPLGHPCAISYEEQTYCTRATTGTCTFKESTTQKTDYIISSIYGAKSLSSSSLFEKYNNVLRDRKCPACKNNTMEIKTTLLTIPPVLIIDTADPISHYVFPQQLVINTATLTPHTPQIISYQLIALTMRAQKKPTDQDLKSLYYQPTLGGHYYAIVQYNNRWYLVDEPESSWWYSEKIKNITEIKKTDLLLAQALNHLGEYETSLAQQLNIKNQTAHIRAHQNQSIAEIAINGCLERFVSEYENKKQSLVLFADVPSLIFYEEISRTDLPVPPTLPLQKSPLIDLHKELYLIAL